MEASCGIAISRESRALDLLKRPEVGYANLVDVDGIGPGVPDTRVAEQIEIQERYAGYLARLRHICDEHGWLQPTQESPTSPVLGGAANMTGWWTTLDGLDADRDLVLSGGDSWTGPSISTWFEGEPTVAAFNLMGYRASAIGNHEFDWGIDVLRARIEQAITTFCDHDRVQHDVARLMCRQSVSHGLDDAGTAQHSDLHRVDGQIIEHGIADKLPGLTGDFDDEELWDDSYFVESVS